MTITSEDYRSALRHFPSGVTIVTLKSGQEIHGLTVSAFASVSPDPPLVAVVIDHRHNASELLARDGTSFAVNILAEDQVELSNRFAWIKDEDRFAEGDWQIATTGAPVLADALAWLDCRIRSRHVAGTHTIYIGEVVDSAVPREDDEPLVYWNRGYRRLGIDQAS
jgi:flavin reductase (DIM6/NTAB) family NADH-FMN oxidoreductase RutF